MNEEWRSRVSGYLDDELSPEERGEFERRLASDPELARELAEIRALKEVTESMKLREFPDEAWERYWSHTYNRIERGIGWILISIGAIVFLTGALYQLGVALLFENEAPVWIRVAVASLCGGFAIMLVSIVRERIFMHRRDPYRHVQR